MGMTSPSREQLLAKLTPTQADRLDARDDDATDPAAEELAAAVALVDLHTAGRTVPAAALTGWALDVAAHRLGVLLDDPTDRQKDLHDRALEILAAIRDGKFGAGAPADGTATAASASIGYGSKTDIFATTT